MFRYGSVKKTLIGVVILAMLPALGLILFSALQDRSRDIEENIREAAETVLTIAYREQNLMENTRTLLLAVSLFDEMAAQDIPAIRSILRTALHQTPLYTNLAFVTPQGKILAVARAASTCKGMSDPAIMNKALRLKSFVVGATALSEEHEAPHMHFALPVLNSDDALIGFLTGGVQTESYGKSLAGAELPKDAEVRLLDGHGHVFFMHSQGPASADKPAANKRYKLWMTVATQPEQQAVLEDASTGEKMVHIYRRLYLVDDDTPYMTVVMSAPHASFAAQGNSGIKTVLLLMLGALLAAFATIRLFGEGNISAPIELLVKTARRIRQGDFSSRLDPSMFRGDIGVLADNFNTMADALEAGEKERIQAKNLSTQNNEAKSEFLAAMSHAIRTPMNSVIGIAYLLMKTPLDTRQHGYVKRIYTSASTLLGIINDILDFSNIEAGRFTIERSPFTLSETLDTVLTMCGQKAEESNIRLSVEVADNVPPRLVGDSLRLAQVLTNLAGNAVKFTEVGAVLIGCRLEDAVQEQGDAVQKQAEAAAKQSAPAPGQEEAAPGQDEPATPAGEPYAQEHQDTVLLRFSVTDTGIGMTDEQIAGLFRSFTQADESISRRFGGTGLGLAITNKLVALMGGTIDVKSKYGKGTTMSFTARFGLAHEAPAGSPGVCPAPNIISGTVQIAGLQGKPAPCDQPDAAPEGGENTGPVDASRLAGCEVLLVEDNPVNMEIARELLTGAGAIVTGAVDGQEAVAHYENDARPPFRLILMDVRMPVMDGYEATEKLRAMGVTTPIVAMTAHAMSDERDRCFAVGMNAHISKPIDIDRFFATILECLGAVQTRS